MPGQRLPMRKIRDVLRLSADGMSKRKIAASLSIGATAAGDCIRRSRRAGLSWPLPENLNDEALERLLYPPPLIAAKDRRAQPDWAASAAAVRRDRGSRVPGLDRQIGRTDSDLVNDLRRPQSRIRSTPTTKQHAMTQVRQMALTQDLILSQPDVPTVPDVTD
jgi:hypothetical protein